MAWIDKTGKRFRVRCRGEDGKVVTDSVHSSWEFADIRRKQIDADQASDRFRDPRPGRISLRAWVDIWTDAHIATPATTATYGSHLKMHILPRFGDTPLKDIEHMQVKGFAKQLLRRPLANSSVADIIALLSTIMRAAVTDQRITFNPCQGVRIPDRGNPERPFLTSDELLRIVSRIQRPADRILVITAAYTGMRWGELSGLQRNNINLATGVIKVDPQIGALHEVNSKLWLGPPKTTASARDLHLPPFLIDLLRQQLDSHSREIAFTAPPGGWLRRSAFAKRVLRPAAEGHADREWEPIKTGLHFHDLRHTHSTWIDEDEIREVMIAYRLGHKMKGVRGVYRHPTPAMIAALIECLQNRWARSLERLRITTLDELRTT